MTAETAPPATESTAHEPPPARTTLGRPLIAIVVVQAVWLWWAYSRGWFLQADLSNLAEGVGARPDWAYLTGELGGHFAPVARFVYWVFDELSPLDYGLAVALRVGCQAVSTILLYRLLAKLIREDALVLGIVAVYAFNPLLMAGTAMFTPGITIGIGQVFALLALTTHVRRERGGNVLWAAASGGLLGMAVLCSEQWVVVTVAFPILSAVHFYAGTVRARIVRLIKAWRTWFLLAAPVFVAGLGVLAFAEPTGAAAPSFTASYRLLRNSWLYSVGPSWIGGPLKWFADSSTFIPTSAPSDLVVLLGQLGVAVIVLIGLQRNGKASLAGWLLPLSVWSLSMVLVGYRGFAQLQDLVAITPRYLSALIPMFAIGAALALGAEGVARAAPKTEAAAAAHRDRAVRSRGQHFAGWSIGVATVVVAVIVTSVVSGVRFAAIFGKVRAEQYVANLASTARAAGPNANVYDTDVPNWLISPVEPHHRVSDLLRLSGVPIKINDPSSAPLIAAADGRLVKSVFVPASAVVPIGPCGSAVRGTGTFTFPLARSIPRAEWYLHLQLFQQEPSTISVELIDAAGKIAKPLSGSPVHLATLAALTLRLPTFAPTAVRFHSEDPEASVCFTAIQVGAPFPVVGR